jgi:hypothetical protein
MLLKVILVLLSAMEIGAQSFPQSTQQDRPVPVSYETGTGLSLLDCGWNGGCNIKLVKVTVYHSPKKICTLYDLE